MCSRCDLPSNWCLQRNVVAKLREQSRLGEEAVANVDMETEVRNTRVSINKDIGKLTKAFDVAFPLVKSASEIAELAEGLGISALAMCWDIIKRRCYF